MSDGDLLELKRRMDALDSQRHGPAREGIPRASRSGVGADPQAAGRRRGLSVAAAAARRKAEARKKATEEEQNLTEEEVFRQQQKDLLRGMVVGGKKSGVAKVEYDDPAVQKTNETQEQKVARLRAEADERKKQEVRHVCCVMAPWLLDARCLRLLSFQAMRQREEDGVLSGPVRHGPKLTRKEKAGVRQVFHVINATRLRTMLC